MTEHYTLTLSYGNIEKPVRIVETIKGSSLIEICSKFPLMVAQIVKKLADEERAKSINNIVDDDIPF